MQLPAGFGALEAMPCREDRVREDVRKIPLAIRLPRSRVLGDFQKDVLAKRVLGPSGLQRGPHQGRDVADLLVDGRDFVIALAFQFVSIGQDVATSDLADIVYTRLCVKSGDRLIHVTEVIGAHLFL